MLILLAATVGYFLAVVLPQRLGELGRNEAVQLTSARASALKVDNEVAAIWQDLGSAGPMAMSADQLSKDLAEANAAAKQATNAITQVEAAKALMAEADGVPFQLHSPSFVVSDRPSAAHLEASLEAASQLATAASLQLSVAQHAQADAAAVSSQVQQGISNRSWAAVARASANLQPELTANSASARQPQALMDPLWATWIDDLFNYTVTAQGYSLAQATGQGSTAAPLAHTLNAQAAAISAAHDRAQANAASWQATTIAPLLAIMRQELAAGS